MLLIYLSLSLSLSLSASLLAHPGTHTHTHTRSLSLSRSLSLPLLLLRSHPLFVCMLLCVSLELPLGFGRPTSVNARDARDLRLRFGIGLPDVCKAGQFHTLLRGCWCTPVHDPMHVIKGFFGICGPGPKPDSSPGEDGALRS